MDLHSTDWLLGAISSKEFEKPVTALLDLFFPDQQEFDTEEVHLDKVPRARRLAPFVSPLVAGKPQRLRGFKTQTFTPPYIKPKHVLEPTKQFKRRAGERLNGEMSAQQRLDLAAVEALEDQENQIARREEWMARELLLTGTMTAVGEDHPAVEVDLGRNAAHTVALSGGARWGESGVSPYENIVTWGTTVATNSGVHPGTVVLGVGAASHLLKDATLRDLMRNDAYGSREGMMKFLPQSSGAYGEELLPLGRAGNFEFWQYSQKYEDNDGNVQDFMPTNAVIMGAKKGAAGIRLYAAIKDLMALRAMSRFPKEWDQQDPSVRYLMTQSAPLPILGRPDATFAATVR